MADKFYRISEEKAHDNALVIAYHEDTSLIGKRALLVELTSREDAYIFLAEKKELFVMPLHHCMTVKDYEALPEGTNIIPGKNKAGIDGLILFF